MFRKKLHLHSMMVHVIAALTPLVAVAFILLKTDLSILSINSQTLEMFIYISIPIMFLVSILSIMTGVFERGHMYVKWHLTHIIKLYSSIVLFVALAVELWLFISTSDAIASAPIMGILGFLLIVVNNTANTFLCAYGLKISLGRQSIGKASYEPDLFKKEPFDILIRVGEYSKQKPKYIDLYEENK